MLARRLAIVRHSPKERNAGGAASVTIDDSDRDGDGDYDDDGGGDGDGNGDNGDAGGTAVGQLVRALKGLVGGDSAERNRRNVATTIERWARAVHDSAHANFYEFIRHEMAPAPQYSSRRSERDNINTRFRMESTHAMAMTIGRYIDQLQELERDARRGARPVTASDISEVVEGMMMDVNAFLVKDHTGRHGSHAFNILGAGLATQANAEWSASLADLSQSTVRQGKRSEAMAKGGAVAGSSAPAPGRRYSRGRDRGWRDYRSDRDRNSAGGGQWASTTPVPSGGSASSNVPSAGSGLGGGGTGWRGGRRGGFGRPAVT